MKRFAKRALMGAVVAMTAAATVPLLTQAPASALGNLQGAATIKTAGGGANLQSGDSSTTWTLRLPAGASCPGDSPNDGWRWQTYMVPASVNPNTLTFDSGGPTPQDVGASFRQPLYDEFNNAVVDQQTPAAASPPGPGPIVNIPNFKFSAFAPGNIPAGVYNLGIACTLGSASSTQMSNYWNVQMTVSTAASGTGGPAEITWQNGTLPGAPTGVGLTPGDGQLQVAFTGPSGANPAVTSYTATATGPGGPFTATGAGSPLTITGLTNLSSYSVVVKAHNAVGDGPDSAPPVSGTPAKPAVGHLTAQTPVPQQVVLSWDAVTGGPTYTIDYCTGDHGTTGCRSGIDPGFTSVTSTTPSQTFNGLTALQLYTFTVYYPESNKVSATATPTPPAYLLQDVQVTRPSGALVLTQVCGQYGGVPAESASTGFPAGFAVNTPSGNNSGNAPAGPKTDNNGAPTLTTDPQYPNYPNPATPTYPTHCSLDLGTAKLVTSGGGAGQFFAASGRLNQVTVADSRDGDPGWTMSMGMSTFSAGTGKTFSGNQLGWTNKSVDTAPFTDGSGNTYDQTVVDQPAIAPNTGGTAGAGTPHAVAVAAPPVSGCGTSCTGGLGIATVDARIKVLIPVFARFGTYTGTLTITAA